MNKFQTALCSAFIALLLPSTAALAQEENSQDMWLMAKYDVDGDRVISMDEISTKREKMFGYMDGNQDGDVTFEEYQNLDVKKRELLLQARFNKLDLNADGRLDSAEYASYSGSFDRFDQDGDGKITHAEMQSSGSEKLQKQEDDNVHCVLWVCVKTKLK